MTPSAFQIFKSFYYTNTYLPPVDLSEQELSKHLLKNENQGAAAIAERLISNPSVQKVLSEPLSYDLAEEVPANNAILQAHGFKLLSKKPNISTKQIEPYYSVIEHADLPGWIIKSGAVRVRKDQFILGQANDRNEMAFFTEEESLLRIEMANRIQKVAQEANIDVVIPKKKLVAYANSEGITEPNKKYCVVCEKINILSPEETLQTIKNMDAEHQIEIAKKISTIVQNAGLGDASFHNIRLTPEGKLAFIDTEPNDLMIAKKPGIWNQYFAQRSSVERCARIGLFCLQFQAVEGMWNLNSKNPQKIIAGLEAFHSQVKDDYEKIVEPKLSQRKITFSCLSLGLIPVINAVIAIARSILAFGSCVTLVVIDTLYKTKAENYINEKVPELANISLISMNVIMQKVEEAQKSLAKEAFVKEYQKKRVPIAKFFFATIHGVPYQAVVG